MEKSTNYIKLEHPAQFPQIVAITIELMTAVIEGKR